MTLFQPIFLSIWKRKETKIYLSIAVLYSLMVLASTFLPEKSNFMRFSSDSGYLFSASTVAYILINSVNDFVLPSLTLFLLSYNVFKGEAENHILFLYKDLKRRDIFVAKIASLISIVLIFLGLFLVCQFALYYGRLIHLPIFSPNFWNSDSAENAAFWMMCWVFIMESILSILLAACLSLYFGKGVTLTASFAFSLGLSIFQVLGGAFLYFIPAGYFSYDTYTGIGSLIVSLLGSTCLTLVYSSILIVLAYRYFKQMEY
ncbi:hypothetical protein [Streptococcus merionis]|uniref:Sugar ABC transporter permease n=1 Tax=Streptococcus merionis TaxID=400065 RepID=A0A239SWE5_9STRE|nr:hypothetical protein [Streptococcus merionis]SNU89579.1 sugar ABC transporter permease [Streptococcus merionis]